ncbi:MAG: hypothetical protein ACYC8T_36845 [Myxococcaceae bacterium]
MIATSLLALVLLAAPQSSQTSGTATVPLEQLLPLFDTQKQRSAPPPLEALVVDGRLEGRLTLDSLVVEAHFEVKVLSDARWSRLGLLGLGPDVYLSKLPRLEGATVAALDGQLVFLSREPGSYAFDVSLQVQAPGAGRQRQAKLEAGSHCPRVPLSLQADPAVFRVTGPKAATFAEAHAVFPRNGAWEVAWESLAQEGPKTLAARPPLDPVITEAAAHWVSTLEGKVSLRVRYQLKLDRAQELQLTLPANHRLDRVLINGVPVAAAPSGGVLEVKVAPARLGETDGTLELALSQDVGVFHLSGLLKLGLPQVSWPVAELSAQAYFPAVFNYRRRGGSMEQVEGAESSSPGGLPGKALHFRQYLVAASAPTLELGYSVDISKSYFR